MRKKFITMITVCITATLLLSVTANAYFFTGTCGENLEYGLDIDNLQIDIWGSGDMQNFGSGSNIAMSDRWGGVPSSIKKVDIDEGVTSIGKYAFAFCSLLSDVKLPNTLISIGESAFSYCENLEKIEIPEGTREIGAGAFLQSGVKDIAVPSTATKIDFSAFDTKGHLNIHISDIAAWCNIETSVGFFHGEETTDLYIENKPATNVIIPNGTKRINYHAFYDFSNVKSVTVPKSVTYIDVYAFNKNTMLNVYENSYAHKYAVQNSIPYNIMSYPNTNGNSITISNSQKNNDTVSFTAELSSKEEIQGTIFAAVYDTNGALTNIKSYPAAANNDISITKKDNDYTAKIFWWFDTESMYPMADCAEIKLDEVEKTYSINKDYDNTRGSVTVTENGQEITTAAEGKQITIETSPKSGYGVLSTTVTDTSGNIIEIKNNTFTMPKGDVNITVTFVGTRDSGTFGINNNLTWLLDDNGTLTISGSGQMQDFTSSNIPWNKYNSDIKIIVIKNGVTRISKNAFADCSKMKRVLIDKSVTEIEAAAFKNCSDLSTVEYSGGQSDWEEIYIGAENEQLKNANFIYNSSLSDTAQTDLDYLKYSKNEDNTITITNCLADAVKINIPKEIGGLPVKTIGENAFSGCGGLTSVTIPDSITSIEDYAFSSCPLTNIIISDSVTNLGIGVFSGCSDIKTAVIGNGVTNISELTFSGCGGLTSITIPDGVTAIGGQAFYDCGGLADIKIGNSVTNIGDSAFSGCSSLTNITIPNSVTNIGAGAFSECSGLKDVYISDMAAWCNIEFGNASSNPMYYANKLYVNNKLLTNLEMPDSVTSIRDYTFYNCSCLTSVTIPNSVENIGNASFYNCSGLTSVTIPDSVTSIGRSTFYGCSGLTNITIGNSLTSIDENAFQNCSNLDSVYLSDLAGYLNIEFGNEYSNPMYYANKLYLNNKRVAGDLIIPDGVTKIPVCAFDGCDSLTSITIPDSVTSISNRAFEGCSGITSIAVPENVTSIGKDAFNGCDSLTRVTIPDSVTSIGEKAFYGCNSLEEITLPFIGKGKNASGYEQVFGYIFGFTVAYDSVNKLPSNTTCQYDERVALGGTTPWTLEYHQAYYGYYIPSSLQKVTITSAEQIPYSAFYNCNKLTSITIPDSVTNIYDDAFYNCSGLTTVYYCGSKEEWNKISIGENNGYLIHAKKFVFNYVVK